MNNPTYSQIIDPENYNHIMTNEHLYISAGDSIIKKFIKEEVKNNNSTEVVELGCGPARIITMMADIPGVTLAGIDHDRSFVEYAKKVVETKKFNIKIVESDAFNYNHSKPVDVFYSEGFHHHIKKGEPVKLYLQNIYKQLKKTGAYILGDEVLTEYKDRNERLIKAIIWYSHIISNAKKNRFLYLAAEEAKTLLDDLNENSEKGNIKTKEQINLVLGSVDDINNAACSGDLEKAAKLAKTLVNSISIKINVSVQNDPTMDLSRGDYKICESELKKEVESVGFKLEKSESVGPGKNIGAVSVYLFRK